MVYVRTVEEFYRQNEIELRNFFVNLTGIRDKDMIDETIQEFYVRLISTKALEKFVPDEKFLNCKRNKHFETYICNLFCWILPYMKRKNFRVRYKTMSVIRREEDGVKTETDIWDVIGTNQTKSDFNVASGYYSDQISLVSNTKIKQMLSAFCRFIQKTESPDTSKRLLGYIKYKSEGLRGVDISAILNVSNSSVFSIKKEVQNKMKQWKEQWEKKI